MLLAKTNFTYEKKCTEVVDQGKKCHAWNWVILCNTKSKIELKD